MKNGFWGALLISMLISSIARAEEIYIVSLDDITGPTSLVGAELAAGKAESVKWINANGGINGKKIKFDFVDYAYSAPKAVVSYKRWMSSEQKPALIIGYGTADTEALVGFVTRDKVPFFSHSFSAKITDPVGRSKYVYRPAPYNFFYGPSFSDACRALVQWAAKDWKKKGKKGTPKWIHMGDNHPYPNSPKEACIEYAEQLGFKVLPQIEYTMRPGDFKVQCLALKKTGANYAYLANALNSNIALLKSCEKAGVLGVQFFSNVYGYDETVMKVVGKYASGIVVPLALAPYGSDVRGMKLIKEISGGKKRSSNYVRVVCTMFYIKEALEWADANGGINGQTIKKGMYQKKNWVLSGLEGVCLPSTYTELDHRGVEKVSLYKGVVGENAVSWEFLYTSEIPRDAEWFGR